MIGYIKGVIEHIDQNVVTIDNFGIGYNIILTENNINKIFNIKTEVKIFTYLVVKENEIYLVGFLNKEELNIFLKLTTVSGVGTKSALALINLLSPYKISLAILSGDVNALAIGQGIGKKIAQRIVLELKDKIDANNFIFKQTDEMDDFKTNNEKNVDDAIKALLQLGFSKTETFNAINKVKENTNDTSQLIKLALKNLSN